MQTLSVFTDSIEVGERHRPLNDDAVVRLQASMKDIGLQQPISIRIVEEMELDGVVTSGVPILVAGRHRLEAAKRLGWSQIDCFEIDDDAIKAELWEIAENLHRCDLTKEQRDDHIRRYAELIEAKAAVAVKVGQPVTVSPANGGRGNKGVARQIADATGLSKRTISRALSPPKPPAAPLPDEDVASAQFRALMSAWNRAGPEVREKFLREVDAA